MKHIILYIHLPSACTRQQLPLVFPEMKTLSGSDLIFPFLKPIHDRIRICRHQITPSFAVRGGKELRQSAVELIRRSIARKRRCRPPQNRPSSSRSTRFATLDQRRSTAIIHRNTCRVWKLALARDTPTRHMLCLRLVKCRHEVFAQVLQT